MTDASDPHVDDSHTHLDECGLPVGAPLPAWTAPEPPPESALTGNWCSLSRIDVDRDVRDLFAAFAEGGGRLWTYMPWGPFSSPEELAEVLTLLRDQAGFVGYTIFDRTGTASGVACYLRMERASGSIEVGGITYSPRLARTTEATEAMYLMAARVFDTGFRRYEWKCDDLNAPSRQAAARLGFRYEGTFRQATVYKGRNRDTAWFAMTDRDWHELQPGFASWLDPSNHDAHGRQRRSLGDCFAAP